MRLLVVLLTAITISGCGMMAKLIPAKPQWPEVPKELTEKCPDLKTIEGNQIAVTDLLKRVVENYTLYYECSLKNDGWNDWYVKQRDLYNKVK